MHDEPKKTLILRILQVLEEYSSDVSPMTQGDIIGKLQSNFEIECERKAVARNLETLEKIGYNIVKTKDGVYLDKNRTFENSELRLLIDGVLGSPHINETQSAKLIAKLISLADKDFKSHVSHVYNMNGYHKTKSPLFFYNIEILDEAIEKGSMVEFMYNAYDENGELTAKKDHRYLLNPYQLIVFNEHYYVIGNVDKYDNLTVYRIDKITEIEIKTEKRKDVTTLPGYEKGLNVGKFKTTLPYFFIQEPEKIEVVCDNFMTDHLVDRFGKEIRFEKVDENHVKGTLHASAKAFSYLAMQYGEFMEVIKPDSLREEIKNKMQKMSEKYDGN
ncbi:MAG: WYL domain-containing protein [Clostridia bacterium]